MHFTVGEGSVRNVKATPKKTKSFPCARSWACHQDGLGLVPPFSLPPFPGIAGHLGACTLGGGSAARTVRPAPGSQARDSRGQAQASEETGRDGVPQCGLACTVLLKGSSGQHPTSAFQRAVLCAPDAHSEAQFPRPAQAMFASQSNRQDARPICPTLMVGGGQVMQGSGLESPGGSRLSSRWTLQGPDRPRGFQAL